MPVSRRPSGLSDRRPAARVLTGRHILRSRSGFNNLVTDSIALYSSDRNGTECEYSLLLGLESHCIYIDYFLRGLAIDRCERGATALVSEILKFCTRHILGCRGCLLNIGDNDFYIELLPHFDHIRPGRPVYTQFHALGRHDTNHGQRHQRHCHTTAKTMAKNILGRQFHFIKF